MAVYSYIVINKQGKEKKGSLEADSVEEVKSILRVDGNIPLYVSEQNVLNKDLNITIGKPVKARELCIFCRQFVSLIKAGVVITQALGMLSRHTQNKHLSNVIKKLQLSVIKGESLADSMKEHRNTFPSFMIYMVEAGETSGKLDSALLKLSDHFEKEASTKSQIKKAMIYPIAILIVMIALIFLMMIFVVPNFTEMFAGMGAELPLMTRMVMKISNFFVRWWYLVSGFIILITIAIRIYKNTPAGKIIFGRLALNMPLFGDLNIKSTASRFAGSMSTLISTGIPMIEAIDITSKTIDNAVIKQVLYDVKENLAKGLALSEPLASMDVFPPMVSDMIAIGEETGDIDGMLNKLAAYYEEEVKLATEALLAVMQPLIIIIMACIVGFFVVAMMSPILKMYQILDQV